MGFGDASSMVSRVFVGGQGVLEMRGAVPRAVPVVYVISLLGRDANPVASARPLRNR